MSQKSYAALLTREIQKINKEILIKMINIWFFLKIYFAKVLTLFYKSIMIYIIYWLIDFVNWYFDFNRFAF